MARYIVPDTCALSASFYNEVYAVNADPMLEAIRLRSVEAVAPSLGKAEFLNVSRKKLESAFTSPVLDIADVEIAIAEFLALPIFWVDLDPLTEEAWRLHRNYNLQTGDAYFVEVARQWDAEIWTIDGQFARAARSIHPKSFDLKMTPFL